MPRFSYPPVLAERRAAIRTGDEVPSHCKEFGHAWQDWCDDLTLLLRSHDALPDAKFVGDFVPLRAAYLRDLRTRALRLYDEGRARKVKPADVGPHALINRRSFYDADDAAALWTLNDAVFDQLIYPLAGNELARDQRVGPR